MDLHTILLVLILIVAIVGTVGAWMAYSAASNPLGGLGDAMKDMQSQFGAAFKQGAQPGAAPRARW
jgi:hypothetical protein